MKRYTIEVSEPIYHLLNQQAHQYNHNLDAMLERLLAIAPFILPETSQVTVKEALAALQRLTTLFMDVNIANLEEVLNDPMLELANFELNFDLL